jgi:ATPase subunit of ABC transporter with duplicated ATPase domains
MLHINDLTYRVEGRLLIDHATVALPEGHKVGFVGRNGTGKSTLLKLILGELHRKRAHAPCRRMPASAPWRRKRRAALKR